MSDLAERIATLSPEKQALLLKRLNRQGAVAPQHQTISRRPEGVAPLSFAQERLWFFYQLDPISPLYNTPISVRLKGHLDIPTLEHCLNEIVRRHELLRTTFPAIEGKAVQLVAPSMAISLPVLDLSMYPEAERMVEAQQLVTEESRQVFDLAQGPLMRMRVLRLSEQDHILAATAHHIISDAWTMHVLMQELTALYDAHSRKQPSPLPDLPIQYADFAYWQREWLQGDVLESQLAYWKQNLSGHLPMLELPTDRPRPAVLSDRGARYAFTLPTAPVSELCRQENVTPFMVMLALAATLLYRYAGQDDILIGAPVANRTRSETEGLIGFFSNIFLLRIDLSGDPSFRQLLKRAQAVAIGAYAHQEVPFEKVVNVVQPDRSLAGMPLIQVMMVFQNNWSDSLALPGLELEPLVIDNKTSEVDLSFIIEEHADAFHMILEYSTDLFDESTIIRISTALRTLLETSTADPDQRIAYLPLLTAEERRQMLIDWNATHAAFPEDRCLHHLFEAQVERTPTATAVVCGDEHVSYADLNRRANRLAHHLQGLGVGPDVVVGICLERSVETVVGLMGIVKAGGAYLPLDPAYPSERLGFMLEDARVSVLITQARLVERLPECQATIIRLDTDWETFQSEGAESPISTVTPEHLAYLIYTSGSTGRPKGVLLDHRGRVNNFCDFNRRFEVGPSDRLLCLSSLSFDMSAYDIFGTLAAGGAVVLPEAVNERDPAHWAELMVRHRVTIWHSVPAMLEMLVSHVAAQPEFVPRFLRLVLLGGDWIPVRLPDQLRSLVGDVQVISLGGATEASMDSTIYPIHAVDPSWQSIPYGRPMTNQRCYVLDPRLQPVPIGVFGELYLAGIGLARGYLNCPELTAQKFIVNPLEEEPGNRLYKTGDLVRYHPDGNLELLGRMDYQVKIRGLRIELGEIEAALRGHPSVREAIVAAKADDTGHKRLVGYIVLAEEQTIDLDELRRFLKERLPEYMIPSAFVLLNSLPLTPNGKVDRKNLPSPEQGRLTPSTIFVEPRTPTEQTLADIWAQLLGVERVSILDNFFALGGDSIRSIQAIARANQAGLRLKPKHLFQYQTIAELAVVAGDAALDQETDQGSVVDLAPQASSVRTNGAATPADFPLVQLSQQQLDRLLGTNDQIEDIYPLSAMQQYMLLQALHHPKTGLYVIHANYLFLPGVLDVAVLQQAWQRVVDHHPVLRSSFAWQGLDQPVQLVHRHASVIIEQLDWRGHSLAEQEEMLETLIREDRRHGYDLTQAPLIRIILAQIADDIYKYVFSNHHIILDGWSRTMFQKQVFDVYQAIVRGEVFELPPSRPFRDFVAWQLEQNLSEAEHFWRQTLHGFTAPTPLPKKSARASADQEDRFVKHRIALSTQSTTALNQLARQQRLTPNAFVQGAWLLLLSRYSGQHEVVLGVTSSGRPVELAGVESIVGLCINTLPLRVQIVPEQPLVDWLRGLQAQQVEMRQYEYTPLPKIKEWSELPPDTPLFECALVFENFPSNLRSISGNVDFSHPLAQKDYQVAQVELPLRVEAVPGPELLLVLCYYQSQFDQHTATQMLHDWQAMLERMLAQPEQVLSTFLG